MKNKLFVIPALFVVSSLLLLTFASALSIRGNGGTINYIGSDTFLTPSKSHLSWNDGAGAGHLEVTAKNSLGQTVVLIANFKGQYATYWKKGILPQRLPTTITFNYNPVTGLTDVQGVGGVNFLVTGIPTVQLP